MSDKFTFLTTKIDQVVFSFQNSLSQKEVSDMNILLQIVAKIDNILDGLVKDIKKLHQQELSILHGIKMKKIEKFLLTKKEEDFLYSLLSCSDKKNKLFTIVENIFDCQKHMRNATNLIEYIKWRYREGAYSADLCLLVTDIENKDIEKCGRQLMGYVNLVDSAFDLQKDYKNGEILFKPHILMQLKLAIIAYQKYGRTMQYIANKTQKDIVQTLQFKIPCEIPFLKTKITINIPIIQYGFSPNIKNQLKTE